IHARRFRGRVHVDCGNAAQLGCVVSGERLLQTIPAQDGYGAALRSGLASRDDLPVLRVDSRDVAVELCRARVEALARAWRRYRPRADSPLGLAATPFG